MTRKNSDEELGEQIRELEERLSNTSSRAYDAEEWAKTFRLGGSSRGVYDSMAYEIRLEQERIESDLSYLRGFRDGRDQKNEKMKKSYEREPILILRNEDKIREGEYSKGHLMVLGWFERKDNNFYQLVPKTSTYRTLENEKLIECPNLINYPYDRSKDEIFVGLREIAGNLEKILDKNGKYLSKDFIIKISKWYGETLV